MSDNIDLRELQLLVEQEFSVEDSRKDLTNLCSWFQSLPDWEDDMNVFFHNERKLPVSLAKEIGVFFVPDSMSVLDLPEEYRTESLGFVRVNNLVFGGRLVYPVKDPNGFVMGFCGWDKFAKPKYLDSKNHGYKAKSTTLFGMEDLKEYYSNN